MQPPIDHGAEGTRYADVRGLMIGEMVRLALRMVVDTRSEEALSPVMRLMLESTFARTVDIIADTLHA
ncbi:MULTISPECIES: hypothetical protein [unclassified Ensifer]|uniref:hypothetical protein n=1 Tax=unclassified Ensifer TaxID=2633371 RepID=UPI000813C1B4|nr:MULTISPECIES: hypothetical protein [unclassified Ensifer]OCP02747.1 hypothetical protein BC362_02405 [Ensifer sp. LC14]OCP13648.1 hypothetical protein BC374_12445 [Ensifer sp. LC13]OCP14307.1 hypothetical protein BBX50_12725 [Ensifer sp. LC11]OCP29010.1 hypothetical protein BC364_10845 [Ensifer sp. LC499]